MMPRLWVATVLIWSPTAALIATAADATTIPAPRPNVIVIMADAWVRESVCWIEAHARTESRPFFLLLTPHDIHVPRVPHERFQGTTRLGPRGDCIMELDWTVGEVTAAVDRLGLAADTLIVFCSDNGPVLDDGYKDDAVAKLGDHRAAGPFRDGKYSVYEGGTRTPFIARWPGRIAPGVSDAIVCTIDLATSVAAIIGATVPGRSAFTGMNSARGCPCPGAGVCPGTDPL
jgi:arylsulfatase A